LRAVVGEEDSGQKPDQEDRYYRNEQYPAVASGIRCKSDGRGSGFMVMLGDDTDIPGGVAVLGSGYFA
jgi:hypothetical protein